MALGLRMSFDVTLQRLKRLSTGESKADRPSVVVAQVDKMARTLEGMTADAWPERMYSLQTGPEDAVVGPMQRAGAV